MINVSLHRGDCLHVLRSLPDNSVDAVVTDPPYGLSFMGKKWDYDVPSVAIWAECLRVLKPGGHLLAFAGTRTQHRMAARIEDAGFEIRDMIAWVYGSGFPKSLDVSKAIDKAGGTSTREQAQLLRMKRESAGLTREQVAAQVGCTASSVRDWEEGRARAIGAPIEFIVPSEAYRSKLADLLGYSVDGRTVIGVAADRRGDGSVYGVGHSGELRAGGSTDAARQWQGWGTALKPALEPITVARKPLVGTVASNVLEHGTGAINVDGCRVDPTGESRERVGEASSERRYAQSGGTNFAAMPGVRGGDPAGRWPANLIHDGSDEVIEAFPQTTTNAGTLSVAAKAGMYGPIRQAGTRLSGGETGSAARFFYCAKASRADRNDGVGGGAEPAVTTDATPRDCETADWQARNGNHHPTVKPTDLMRYLCRLVTPPGGVVLDPFMGSGSTGRGAVLEGFDFIGIERDEDENGDPLGYMEIAEARIAAARRMVQEAANDAEGDSAQGDLFGDAA